MMSQKRIAFGTLIIVVLHSPREKCWGLLDEITAAGVFLRGLDLNSFDDWLYSLLHHEPFVGVNDRFFPLWRVERLTRDETAGGVPSLGEQAERRTGRSVADLLGDDEGSSQ
jgi:hypothetical protein